jgi:uroporphyrinogen decarboxylase
MNGKSISGSLLSILSGETMTPPPVWLMRQAGRYLPEYQATRKQAGSFWSMCMTPGLATEVTLQPIRRFDFDAAILFSDILVVPYALGQQVEFIDNIGPRLGPFDAVNFTRDEAKWAEKLSNVYEAMALSRSQLAPQKALIGFAGGPWTLAAYMIEGHGTADQRQAKLYAYRQPEKFAALLNLLTDAVVAHLIRQIDAGADAAQIFDSWAGGLPYKSFLDWVVAPTRRIVTAIRARHAKARIIGFPRAATERGYETYAGETGVDAVSLDTATDMHWAVRTFGKRIGVQGNLDPIALIAGGDALDRAIDSILEATRGAPFIFNLGHGVLPETPVEHVAQLVARVRRDRT